ncbi:MAG: glucosaminidase domain-containing protein [Bradyrhizobium sp.]
MGLAFTRLFRLAGPRGDGRNPYVNADGAFIGCGVPLLERDPVGRWRPREETILERVLAVGYGTSIAHGQRIAQLRHVAQYLNDGDVALAQISLLRMQLPPLASAEHARAMAKADGVIAKDAAWEDEPRVPAGSPDGGEWTDEDGSGATEPDAEIIPVAARVDATRAKKERFVDKHLAYTEPIAERLGIPVENILGLAALESTWGTARFATDGKNLFGIHYPAPFATGYLQARRGPAKVATYSSYADGLRSFVAVAGSLVQGIHDPTAFAAALWNSGKFGVGNPTYVRDLANTIRGLRPIVSPRRT